MEQKIMYVCTGGCNGVSPVAKGCGAESCAHFGKPLEPRVQCEACAAKTASDGQPHACAQCVSQ